MDTKLFWSLVAEEERRLITWQHGRRDAVARDEADSDPLQPLTEPYLYSITIATRDGQQKGGAVNPLAFKIAARKFIGDNGTPTHRPATTPELEQFFADQERRRGEIQTAQDRAEHRERLLVSMVPPAPHTREKV